tara:strand:+ start:206 stop:973 length:768 start_codon:yes stop_codon:yes gene_type:complete
MKIKFNKIKYILFNILLISLFFSNTGLDIAYKLENKIKPKDMKATLEMQLINKKGHTRLSSLKSFTKNGGEKQIAWFLSPADDKGIGFLKIEHDDKDDEMRIYLPAFKKVRRISSKKKSDSFMGSDLSYEDMSNRNIEENTYKLLSNELINNEECYVLEITPKSNIKTEYSKHIVWITINEVLPIKEQSYDKSGGLLKEKQFHFSKIDSYHIADTMKVFNIQKQHTTILTFKDVKINTNIDDKIFHEKNLKRILK